MEALLLFREKFLWRDSKSDYEPFGDSLLDKYRQFDSFHVFFFCLRIWSTKWVLCHKKSANSSGHIGLIPPKVPQHIHQTYKMTQTSQFVVLHNYSNMSCTFGLAQTALPHQKKRQPTFFLQLCLETFFFSRKKREVWWQINKNQTEQKWLGDPKSQRFKDIFWTGRFPFFSPWENVMEDLWRILLGWRKH